LVSALSFAINVTDYKLDLPTRQATCPINADNVLGATLACMAIQYRVEVAEFREE